MPYVQKFLVHKQIVNKLAICHIYVQTTHMDVILVKNKKMLRKEDIENVMRPFD